MLQLSFSSFDDALLVRDAHLLRAPGSSVYTASKGALDAFTNVLADELGPRDIRVNSIKPGLTATGPQSGLKKS